MRSLRSIAVLLALTLLALYLVTKAAPDNDLVASDTFADVQKSIAQSFKYIDPKTGYRTGHYRAALPSQVPGGKTINVEDAKALHDKGNALFVDVMAATGAGYDPLDGTWRLSKQRSSIPGAIWLPEVGNGYLTKTMSHYYKEHLTKATKGNKTHPIVLFCEADCWMAWNAARRASLWGYTNLYWYPEGINDWEDKGYKLVGITPRPVSLLDD